MVSPNMKASEAKEIQSALDMIGEILVKSGKKQKPLQYFPNDEDAKEEDHEASASAKHEFLKPLLEGVPQSQEKAQEARPSGPVRIVIRSQASAAQPR